MLLDCLVQLGGGDRQAEVQVGQVRPAGRVLRAGSLGVPHPLVSHVAGEPFRPAGGHLAPGLGPALGDVALDQPRDAFPLVSRLAGLPGALGGALVHGIHDSQPQGLGDGIIIGELGACLEHLAHLPVERLDRYLELSRQPGL